MPSYTFKAYIRRERFFVAECPELGIEAQGRSVEEALACLRLETIEYIESLGEIDIRTIAASPNQPSAHRAGVITRRYTIDVPVAQEHTPDPTEA